MNYIMLIIYILYNESYELRSYDLLGEELGGKSRDQILSYA